MADSQYNLTFTTCGLLHRDTMILLELYPSMRSWSDISKKVIDENLLRAKSSTSLKRIMSELTSRAKLLSDSEINFLLSANQKEQLYFFWILMCRRYRIIEEFAVEVLREKYITSKNTLNYVDYDVFYNSKAELNNLLYDVAESTRYKIRQVLFKMMRDAGLLSKDNKIIPMLLTEDLVRLIYNNNKIELSYFPAFDSDYKGLIL